ncbi:hypothetical protein PM082_024298 [Marasmius tenuissimus]|nr:hypothetical protein PM082_024298 [Marasmius tenuissimus]
MEESYGVERGSYIWGRSIHNIHIERLWRDVTTGFAHKWREFFKHLEATANLRPDNDAQMWLLHHLFEHAINEEALSWAEAWNNHAVSMRRGGKHERSPHDMFFFGQIQNGFRDMSQFQPGHVDMDTDSLAEEDLESYGVDWGELDDADLLHHHFEENHEETTLEWMETDGVDKEEDGGWRRSRMPRNLSHVVVPVFSCPFSDEEVCMLDEHLAQQHHAFSDDMTDRRSLWVSVLLFCRNIVEGQS